MMSHSPHQTDASTPRMYADDKPAMYPPSPPPSWYAGAGGHSAATVEADVADTYTGSSGHYYAGNGNGHGPTDYPYSPSDVQQPSSPRKPGLLSEMPPPSVVDDDTASVASLGSSLGSVRRSVLRYAANAAAGRLPNIDEGAAASSGPPWQQSGWADAAAPEPPRRRRSSRFFGLGRLKKERPVVPEPQPPTAAFRNLSTGAGGGGGGSNGAQGPGQESAAALGFKITAADIRETTDLMRQLYRMELLMYNERFAHVDDEEAAKAVKADLTDRCARADLLRAEIERRVLDWSNARGSAWDRDEQRHVDYSVANIRALVNLGKETRRELRKMR